MRVVKRLDEWRAAAEGLRRRGRTVGLVPTMGALHAGHRALCDAARERGDALVVTLFVNPRQFDDPADLARYPRTPAADLALALEAGADLLVEPTGDAMWPRGAQSVTVSAGDLARRFEGRDRPGHFDGVASVVAKLFAVTGPCRAYFGEKDYQQLCVVRALAGDLGFDVEVVGVPLQRDPDGLALSSRNVRLSASGRASALGLSRALVAAASGVAAASALRERMRVVMEDAGVEVAYAEVVDPATLAPLDDDAAGPARALVAGLVEGVRLIDNAPVEVG
ncbi:MAG TPA: pantoate--beta-alanine ligase [Acidimicrobiales bacterium]|nr:MAG: pantoate--beta-alanine ligase [Actinobacteria bacterium 21-73-9]HQU26861.1 pantoate--beta-alanine ligase [Acidimicrobiales bacterium]